MCDIKEHKLAQRLEKDLSATLKPVLTVGVGSLGGGSSVVSKEKVVWNQSQVILGLASEN